MNRRNRQARRADMRERAGFIFGFLLILLALWLIHVHQGKLDNEERQLRHQAVSLGNEYQFAVEACTRLQIVRVEDNVSHYADFKVFRVVLKLSRAAIKQGRLVGNQLKAELEFLKPLAEAVRLKEWVPVTDCRAAVNKQGIRYRAPRPVPFVKRLPPPSALSLRAADFH